MTVLQWMLAILGALFLLLILLWFGSYFISRAWHTAKLKAISSFASRKSLKRR